MSKLEKAKAELDAAQAKHDSACRAMCRSAARLRQAGEAYIRELNAVTPKR